MYYSRCYNDSSFPQQACFTIMHNFFGVAT
ncbi:Uncharacterised protein (plasmid) [Klebsiella aerogenes]|nr:Uncharacterised protein [Klebsiella aerogenes]